MAGYYDQMNYSGLGAAGSYAPAAPVNATMPASTAAQTGASGAFVPQMGANGQVGTMNGSPLYQTPQLTGWQKFGYVMDGIGAVGGLWGSIQQNKIAKEQLNLAKESYNTNMNNTIQSYNTALEDRIRARYAMEGRSDQADAYIEENKLSRS